MVKFTMATTPPSHLLLSLWGKRGNTKLNSLNRTKERKLELKALRRSTMTKSFMSRTVLKKCHPIKISCKYTNQYIQFVQYFKESKSKVKAKA